MKLLAFLTIQVMTHTFVTNVEETFDNQRVTSNSYIHLHHKETETFLSGEHFQVNQDSKEPAFVVTGLREDNEHSTFF